jgi:hypothetical protein
VGRLKVALDAQRDLEVEWGLPRVRLTPCR